MTPTRKLLLETTGALAGVALITIAYAAAKPAAFASGIIPLILLFELSIYVGMVALVAVIGTIKNRTTADNLGFRLRPFVRQILIGVAIFCVTISFVIVPLLLGVDRSDLLSFKARNPLVLLYYLVFSFVFVGLGEELVWRGYFFNRTLEITRSGATAVILPALLFGLWHYPNGQNVQQVLATALLGMFYGFARLKIRDCSTMATGIAHGLHDVTILILSYFLL